MIVTALAIVAAPIGVMLGLRFKVFILAPAIVSFGTVILIGGVVLGSSFWSIFLATLLAISALQMGYLAGTIICFFARDGARRQKSIRKHCGDAKRLDNPTQA